MTIELKETWEVITREHIRTRIPYGYRVKEDDPYTLLPVPEVLTHLETAFEYLDNGSSLREAVEWLNAKVPHLSLSHQGISIIWKKRRKGLGVNDNLRIKKLKAKKKNELPRTPEEIAKHKLIKQRAAARRSITGQTKKLNKIISEEKSLTEPTPEEFSSPEDLISPSFEEKEEEVVFRPNPGPQTDFLEASEQEVLYGGAAGGGKSFGLLADAMRYFDNPNFNGLLLRRTNDELRELKWKSQELYPKAFKKANWKEKDSMWVFPSGARLWMTYLERDEDVLRYQGQAFTWIAVDELTQYATPFAWDYLRSRLRSTDPNLDLCMRATSNPGGPGHGWVKRMFVDPSPSNKPFPATDIDTGEPLVFPKGHAKEGKHLFKRKFIPAKLSDNPYLYEGGQYEASLLSLPEQQRRQLLEGDWNVSSGAAFPEFRVATHVVEPYPIPPEWRRFRSCDFGYSSHSAVHWWAIDPAYETLVCYRELYVSKMTGEALADEVLKAERGEQITYGVLDSSVWANRGHPGPSIAEVMIARGCRWRPSDRSPGSRIAGRNRLHELLKVNEETGLPGIVFFDTCRQIIADLAVIPTDPKGGEDIDDRYASDHTYDSVRYAIMTRPRSKSVFDWDVSTKSSYRPSDNTFGY